MLHDNMQNVVPEVQDVSARRRCKAQQSGTGSFSDTGLAIMETSMSEQHQNQGNHIPMIDNAYKAIVS